MLNAIGTKACIFKSTGIKWLGEDDMIGNPYAFIGTICGVLVGVLIAFLVLKLIKNDKSVKSKYDERQEVHRGRAYKYGFFTLMGYCGLLTVFEIADVELPFEDSVTIFLGVLIAIGVFATVAIENDAYIALNENYLKVFVSFALIGASNMVIGAVACFTGNIIVDGKVSCAAINIFAGIILIYLLILCERHHYLNEESEVEDEEP